MDPEANAPLVGPTKVSSRGNGITLLHSLLSSINSRSVPKRALFSNMTFEIGPDFRISVKGYILFKRQEVARKMHVYLGGEKVVVPQTVRTEHIGDGVGDLKKQEIRKAYKFGGEQIAFTPEEIKSLRTFGDPILRIIGFKPVNKHTLPIWASTGRSSFIYPSEEGYVGSTRVFSALHQKMLKDNKFGVAWFIRNRNSTPLIVAVVAGQERFDEEKQQKLPPGMWLIPLPYADDIRDNPPSLQVDASDELVEKAIMMFEQVKLAHGTYDCTKYPNPCRLLPSFPFHNAHLVKPHTLTAKSLTALQYFYRVLQAIALNEDLPSKAEDKTLPKYKQIHKV